MIGCRVVIGQRDKSFEQTKLVRSLLEKKVLIRCQYLQIRTEYEIYLKNHFANYSVISCFQPINLHYDVFVFSGVCKVTSYFFVRYLDVF